MPTITTIDPNYINLHALLHRYFKGSYAIFADFLGVPILQAERLCQDSIDITLLCLINDALTGTHPERQKPLKSPEAVRLDTQILKTFTTLPLEDILRKNTSKATSYLTTAHRLDPKKARDALALVASICVYYIDKLIFDAKLNQDEQKTWLGLQPAFVREPLADLAAIFDVNLNLPFHTHTTYQKKLGRDALLFDDTTYRIPSYRWLTALATLIKDGTDNTLGVGKMLNLTPLPKTIDTPKSPQKPWHYALAAAVFLGVLAIFLAISSDEEDTSVTLTQTTQEPNETDSAPVIPDVAIVRIDNDDTPAKNGSTHPSTETKVADTKTEATKADPASSSLPAQKSPKSTPENTFEGTSDKTDSYKLGDFLDKK
ncbi:MAG: hypothetical protein Q4B88_04785 [Moraxella sp.]|nr:hypothetical protein [Moraxella sp.]